MSRMATAWRAAGLAALLGCAGCPGGGGVPPWMGGGASGGGPASPNPLAGLLGGEDNYSVLLKVFRGGEVGQQIAEAKRYKEQTEKHAGWRGLFVVHRDGQSLLYWGGYRTMAAAEGNRGKARAYVTPAGVRVYAGAMIVPMPGKEAERPEWRLQDVGREYVFTVLLAIFYDVPEAEYVGRREFALRYCEQLRREGEEAYYWHGPRQSIVTVGRFPASAVKLDRLDKTVAGIVETRSTGDRSKLVMYRYTGDVVDPQIAAIFRKHPDLAVNGCQRMVTKPDIRTGRPTRMPDSTYLVVIPSEKEDGTGSTTAPAGPDQPDRRGDAERRQAP